MFAEVESTGVKPNDFVDNRKRSNKLTMGIGHRLGSLENPDQRVVIIKEYAKANFSSTAILDFESDAGKLAFERGWVYWSVLHRHAEVVRRFSTLQGAGFHRFRLLEWTARLWVGHYLDQLRLKQPLWRDPWDDTSYIDKLAADAKST